MIIKGFIGTSLIDYPNTIACVVFLGKCNYKCPFCHNYELVIDKYLEKSPDISEEEILKKISIRQKFIEGVVITGGEPTLDGNVIEFIRKIKEVDPAIKIKLDTNGSNPDIIKSIISEGIVDYIALDIKTSKEKYDSATMTKNSYLKVNDSIKMLLKSNQDYEFRTTVVPNIVEKKDLIKIGELIKGAKRYILQQYNNTNT